MEKINVTTTLNVSLEKAWNVWTQPEYITQWNHASEDWCCPTAVNNLSIGGTFNYRMEAVDKSFGFDFEGTYYEVEPLKKIAYKLGDARTVVIEFTQNGDTTTISETFDTEDLNAAEKQRFGWQCILENYKKVAEK